MLLNSTNLSKSFSFGMLLINERLSLIPPSHGGWFFGLLLSRSLFIYIKWVVSQNLESPPYNTKEGSLSNVGVFTLRAFFGTNHMYGWCHSFCSKVEYVL